MVCSIFDRAMVMLVMKNDFPSRKNKKNIDEYFRHQSCEHRIFKMSTFWWVLGYFFENRGLVGVYELSSKKNVLLGISSIQNRGGRAGFALGPFFRDIRQGLIDPKPFAKPGCPSMTATPQNPSLSVATRRIWGKIIVVK